MGGIVSRFVDARPSIAFFRHLCIFRKDGLAMPTLFFADLVRELCEAGGTGALTPGGAVPGHRRFADAVPVDTPFHYAIAGRSEEHTSELQSLMRISYAVFCLKKKQKNRQRRY